MGLADRKDTIFLGNNELWHTRLGHLHHEALKIIQQISMGLPKGKLEQIDTCKGCTLGKYGKASFQPRRVEHLPGIVNTVADALSILSDPSKKYAVPEQLAHLQPVPVPIRSEQYYATLATS